MPQNNQSTLDELQETRDRRKAFYQGRPYDQVALGPPTTNLNQFFRGAIPAQNQGMANLLDILRSQGRTDQGAFNRQLVDIGRGTEAQQQQFQDSAFSRGLQNSGAAGAIDAAIGQGGQNRRATAFATENALAEERRRADLQLLLDLIINPQNELFASAGDLMQRERERASDYKSRKWASYLGFLGSALGSGGSIFGGGGSGGGGTD